MIRTFIKPTQSNYSITLTLPKDYIGQEIEIIAFKKEEGLVKEKMLHHNRVPQWIQFNKLKRLRLKQNLFQ